MQELPKKLRQNIGLKIKFIFNCHKYKAHFNIFLSFWSHCEQCHLFPFENLFRNSSLALKKYLLCFMSLQES